MLGDHHKKIVIQLLDYKKTVESLLFFVNDALTWDFFTIELLWSLSWKSETFNMQLLISANVFDGLAILIIIVLERNICKV